MRPGHEGRVVSPGRVAVIGAGAVGLCCAYYLHKKDVDVVVIDRGIAGHGCSYASGGWICPAQSGPLPEPGLTLFALRALFNPELPLYFKASVLPELAPWLLQFRRYCNKRSYVRGLESIAELGVPTFDQIDEMIADGVEFELHRNGALVAAKDPAVARASLEKLEPMRKYGYELPRELIGGSALHELEPALSPAITTGFLLDQQMHVDSESFSRGLAAWLIERGVQIIEGDEVVDFDQVGRGVRAVRTVTTEIEADGFVLAAGSWTPKVAGLLGLKVPIVAGKGYSFLIRPSVVPRRALLLVDVYAGATPFGEKARIGGTLEFSGLNLRIDRRRLESIARGAREALLEWASPELESVWAGMRPMTPDGLPILDLAEQFDNVYVASGHSFQGLSLGPPSGHELAELIVTGRRSPVLERFRLGRFRTLPRAFRR
jgi:D-amino-acid dehydrogenase